MMRGAIYADSLCSFAVPKACGKDTPIGTANVAENVTTESTMMPAAEYREGRCTQATANGVAICHPLWT